VNSEHHSFAEETRSVAGARPRNPVARTFRDLIAYQKARQAVNKVFELTASFPRDEKYELASQMRRSSRSAKSMIAAAWARRRYRAAFVSKLDEALEEAVETQSWLDDALDRSYITTQQFHTLDAEWQGIGAMIQGMMNRADDFCKTPPDKTRPTP
jgi:four helix bundle protein